MDGGPEAGRHGTAQGAERAADGPRYAACVQVGFGTAARVHRQALRRLGVRVAGAIDVTRNARTLMAAEGVRNCADYAEAAALGPVVWDVCTPTHAHVGAFARISALDPYADVIIEKPLCDHVDIPAMRALLRRHRGRVVVNENYCSSVLTGQVAGHVRLAGVTPSVVTVEMSKNRIAHYAAGRFTDARLGAFGYEGTHLVAVAELLGARFLTGELLRAGTRAVTVPSQRGDAAAWRHQGTAFAEYRTADGCRVRLHTAMDGGIGHPYPPFARPGQRIEDAETRYRVVAVEGRDRDGVAHTVTGFFEPLPGHARARASLVVRAGGSTVVDRLVVDDTAHRHLGAALAHFAGHGPNPCPPERAIAHLERVHHWARHAIAARP
ncbi:Gfo/Idh/MocA family oxidoreductase [Actinocorallia sp. A-T 12471]|uniref:Gfo/Idh/MocA family oxidoreductase n=1 Tax=Actinocorallia sp. A-T 12471 TaxID=3089813 RepID=UPI0029D18727|nr:Gfo/Idh/MocA family oxidoreductase [Actinocorallia sp. A-T 12471]MDX6742348.1 Gfo/Idh/MocA family oxidoreductase [Actinocorallia sp. A-T 12471]